MKSPLFKIPERTMEEVREFAEQNQELVRSELLQSYQIRAIKIIGDMEDERREHLEESSREINLKINTLIKPN